MPYLPELSTGLEAVPFQPPVAAFAVTMAPVGSGLRSPQEDAVPKK